MAFYSMYVLQIIPKVHPNFILRVSLGHLEKGLRPTTQKQETILFTPYLYPHIRHFSHFKALFRAIYREEA